MTLLTPRTARPSDEEMQRIMAAYGTQMKRVCYLYLHDVGLAEDAAQEAFIKIYKHFAAFRGECAEKTWIMRITVNVCRDMLRSSWQKKIDHSLTPEMLVLSSDAPGDDFAVLDAVMHLPAKLREVIILRYYQEMTLSDIAKALKLTRYMVNQRIKSAQDMLRKELKGWYFDEP